MITFKIIRKIGKILRGGAGKKEIFLGTLCGVLLGFNPSFSFTVLLVILLTLLLNANISFTILGVALGKALSLLLAPVSFQTGFFIIHNMGLEGVFRKLCNAPVTALMDLNVYALVGGFPYALGIGIALGIFFGSLIKKTREKMLELEQHEVLGKTLKAKMTRFLMWLAFGKNKLTLEDEIPKQAPLFRKAGLIIVGIVIVIGFVLEFFLLDITMKKGLQSAISKATGAEVDIDSVHFSIADGELDLKNLQVTDPDKPTHNLMQLDNLTLDVSIHDLLCKNYVIDLMEGSLLKCDTPRETPGKVYLKKEKKPEEKPPVEELPGKSLEDYFAKAQDLKKYSEKAYDYLKKRKENAKEMAKGEQPKASKEVAVADAKKAGYLLASADLVANRPAWLIHKIRIDHVQLGGGYPEQTFQASEVSSHPELNGKPTNFSMTPVGETEPSVEVVLRFDDPSAPHAVSGDLENVNIGEAIETSDSFPVDITDGKVDIKAGGTFSADTLNIPFTILAHGLKANVEEGQSVMGMDSATASEVLSSMDQLEIDGALVGSLLAPRVKIDYDKLTSNMKEALVAAGKKELANRANAEMDKAKEEVKEQIGKEIKDVLKTEEGGSSVEDKAKDALKKIF